MWRATTFRSLLLRRLYVPLAAHETLALSVDEQQVVESLLVRRHHFVRLTRRGSGSTRFVYALAVGLDGG